MKTSTVEILIDASPILTFTYLTQRALKIVKTPLDLCDFPSELVRFENDLRPARAGQVLVRFYPSDRFLDFAAALFAGNLNLGAVKESGHNKPQKGKKGISSHLYNTSEFKKQ